MDSRLEKIAKIDPKSKSITIENSVETSETIDFMVKVKTAANAYGYKKVEVVYDLPASEIKANKTKAFVPIHKDELKDANETDKAIDGTKSLENDLGEIPEGNVTDGPPEEKSPGDADSDGSLKDEKPSDAGADG